MRCVPLELDSKIAPLPANLQGQIGEALDEPDFKECACRVTEILGFRDSNCGSIPRLLVCCLEGASLAQKCLEAEPKALWGAKCGRLAVVYKLSTCAIWHESLHLLGATDCYNKENLDAKPEPTCKHKQCIMQYEPTRGTVDGRLPLCNKNVELIFAKFKDWQRWIPACEGMTEKQTPGS